MTGSPPMHARNTTTIAESPPLQDTTKSTTPASSSNLPPSTHPTYPHPIARLPPSISEALNFVPAADARAINDQPDLDLLYYAPYIPKTIHRELFRFLRASLPFYRVCYTIKRGPVETEIRTPRFTTVFGIDDTSIFAPPKACAAATASAAPHDDISTHTPHDKHTLKPHPASKYTRPPRPLPHSLALLKTLTEATTNETYNFCLVNYYASGADSISYHSDDERFLGALPAIASLSLGAKRDFLMKHKPSAPATSTSTSTSSDTRAEVKKQAATEEAKPLKLPLASGDMVLMRGRTQSMWLHSVPKRKGGESDLGRINITFRKALGRGGTENYYRYNVGDGGVFRWDEGRGEMVP